LESKKGEDILLLDIDEVSDFTDFFVICSGTSDRQLDTLADEVMTFLKDLHHFAARLEGTSQDGWMVIDYGDIVIHLFSPARRDYYRLEELWSEGKVLLRLH